jgi:hypothetical protein
MSETRAIHPYPVPDHGAEPFPFFRGAACFSRGAFDLKVGVSVHAKPVIHPIGLSPVCRRVRDDFAAMMVGGIGVLILRALHPLALAGVLDI